MAFAKRQRRFRCEQLRVAADERAPAFEEVRPLL
jgi:hypothetical protein